MTSNGAANTFPVGSDNTDLNDNNKGQTEKLEIREQEGLSSVKHRVNSTTAGQLRIVTLVVSWLSVVVLCILGAITFVVAIVDESSSSFAFALDAWLDCLSSIVVIWRFFTAESLYNKKKEKVACIALGVLFLISFVSVLAQSTDRLIDGKPPLKRDIIWYLAIVNGITCLMFFSAKAYLAYKLESVAIATDAVNSGIGFLLALATGVGDIVHEEHPTVWYIDPVLGVLCSLFLFIYGIWIIVYEVKLNNHSQEYTSMEE